MPLPPREGGAEGRALIELQPESVTLTPGKDSAGVDVVGIDITSRVGLYRFILTFHDATLLEAALFGWRNKVADKFKQKGN